MSIAFAIIGDVMQNFYTVFSGCPLFFGIENISGALERLDVRVKRFDKNKVVREAEAEVKDIGVVLEGAVYTTKFDIYGSRVILDEITKGLTFGESLVFTEAKNSPISIVSAGATVGFISVEKLMAEMENSELSGLLSKNLIRLLAQKNLLLQMKNDILSQTSIRKKLLLYFEYESKTANSNHFKIHFSREELADFLCLNPSALSRELGKMRDEGILTFTRNRFTLRNICP